VSAKTRSRGACLREAENPSENPVRDSERHAFKAPWAALATSSVGLLRCVRWGTVVPLGIVVLDVFWRGNRVTQKHKTQQTVYSFKFHRPCLLWNRHCFFVTTVHLFEANRNVVIWRPTLAGKSLEIDLPHPYTANR
jgi:hypothetical protein